MRMRCAGGLCKWFHQQTLDHWLGALEMPRKKQLQYDLVQKIPSDYGYLFIWLVVEPTPLRNI